MAYGARLEIVLGVTALAGSNPASSAAAVTGAGPPTIEAGDRHRWCFDRRRRSGVHRGDALLLRRRNAQRPGPTSGGLRARSWWTPMAPLLYRLDSHGERDATINQYCDIVE